MKNKEYHRQKSREWYQKNKTHHLNTVSKNRKINVRRNQNWLLSYLKDKTCVDCGEDDIVTFEFDHCKGNKVYNISDLIRHQASIVNIIKEIEKCEIVCANCHKRRTAKQFSWYKLSPNGEEEITQVF